MGMKTTKWTHRVEWQDGDEWILNSEHKSERAAERELARIRKAGATARVVVA